MKNACRLYYISSNPVRPLPREILRAVAAGRGGARQCCRMPSLDLERNSTNKYLQCWRPEITSPVPDPVHLEILVARISRFYINLAI